MRLNSPKGDVSRPIVNRVKESLYSVLYSYDLPAGAVVADVFSGVGSLGLEALSRGAEFVTFVEQDPKIESVLKKNIEKAGFIKQSKVVRANAYKVGAVMDFDKGQYDLVFVDPPYPTTKDVGEDSRLGKLFDVLVQQVKDSGIAVVRTNEKSELLASYGIFDVVERRKWGTMNIAILKKGCDEQ